MNGSRSIRACLGAALAVLALAGCPQRDPTNRVAPTSANPKQGGDGSMTQEAPVSRQDGVTQPGRDEVLAAVQRSGDRQLATLMGDGGHVLRPTELAGVSHHRVFRVLFTDTDHPMSFWLATDKGGGNATVLSQHLDGVAAFLRAEPELWNADDLPRRFHDLYRDQSVHSEVLSSPAPVVERRGDGRALRLAVRSDGRSELWKVELPAAGSPKISVEALP